MFSSTHAIAEYLPTQNAAVIPHTKVKWYKQKKAAPKNMLKSQAKPQDNSFSLWKFFFPNKTHMDDCTFSS